jgi:Protein of unknown function (DUF1822)
MFRDAAFSSSLKFRQPEAIWLESKQLESALSGSLTNSSVNDLYNEADQWQLYLNALALCGFEQWLQQRNLTHFIDRTQCINQIGAVYNFKIGQFKLNLIVREQVLDEIAEIPKAAIKQPDLAAHFHVLLEVSEEQRRVIIRGFLRYDRLMRHCNRVSEGLQNDNYSISLSAFDLEPNHLLFYCEFLEPASIPLPLVATKHTAPVAKSETALTTLTAVLDRIHLGHWIKGIFAPGWQAINELVSPEVQLAWNPRNLRRGERRGKLIDLGMELQGQRLILLVSVTEEVDQDLSVLVQLHPAGADRYLPPQIGLTLLSQSGKKLQEVYARRQDNYIQLKSFKGRSGILFSIVVTLGSICLREIFEL